MYSVSHRHHWIESSAPRLCCAPALVVVCLIVGLATTCVAEVIEDLMYESPGSTDPHIDLYLPPQGLLLDTPTVLYVHGGAWVSGDKSEDAAIFHVLADAGYAVLSANYTLTTPEHAGYPQAMYDMKAVVRWIRTEGTQYGLSPTVVATGPSVGGYFTQFLATTQGAAHFEPLPPPPGGYAIQAGISFWGLSDLQQQAEMMGSSGPLAWFMGGHYDQDTEHLYIEASPLHYTDDEDAPMHLVHGLDDPWYPWRQSFWMHEALTQVGVFCGQEYFAAGHGYEAYGGALAAADTMLEMIPTLLAAGRTPDITQDGLVDIDDVLVVVQHWGGCPNLPVDCPADLDADGVIGIDDLLAVLAAFGGG